MAAPTLTFLIPTWNRAAAVTRAIDSVLADAHLAPDSFEIVVVDDGSTDDTAQRMRAYASDDRIRYLPQPTNRGVAAARNVGIAAALGDWLVLLDSDNRLESGALALLLAELQAVPASVGIFWGNCRLRSGATTTTHATTGTVPGVQLVEGRFPGEHFSVVRAELARRHPFAELGTRNECAACFWYPIALESDLHLSTRVFQFYETDGDDRVTSYASRRHRAPELVRCFEETLLRFGPLLEQRTPVLYWGLKGRIALYLAVSGEWWSAVRAAMRGVAGSRIVPSNLAVLAICVAGPWCARAALRHRADA